MSKLATTKMSSKGQVVIPEEIRQTLGLRPGTQLVCVAADGAVVLRAIAPPAMAEFDEILAEARRQARLANMKRADIQAAIDEVRAEQ